MEAELKRTVTRALHRPPLDRPRRDGDHTLRYAFAPDVAWVAARYLRTPSRVLWELAHLKARRLEPLFQEVKSLAAQPNAPWRASGLGISVVVARHGDFPASPLQIRGTVKNALLEGSKATDDPLTFAPEDPDLIFLIRQSEQGLSLSIDLGAGSLHRRGYRKHIGPAPLKETLAAQLLILARWDARSEALVDPMAGAGTIVMEGALMATGEPLGRPSRVLECLSMFRPFVHAEKTLFPGTKPVIIAGEPDTSSFAALVANAKSAGLEPRLRCIQSDFSELFTHEPLPEQGLIVVNPPYGERMEVEDPKEAHSEHRTDRAKAKKPSAPDLRESESSSKAIEKLYQKLLDWHAALGPNWRLGVLTTHGALDELTSRPCRMKKPLRNGPLKAWFWLFDGQ